MGVAVLVGTRKGLFVLTSDETRRDWTVEGPHLTGFEVFHATRDPRDGTVHAATNNWVYGATAHRSSDQGETWERAEQIGRLLRTRLDGIAAKHPDILGEVRGLGAMLALELVEQSGDASRAVTTAAREKGLVLLSCGLHGNVIRLLPPLSATDEELEKGLAILDEALAG